MAHRLAHWLFTREHSTLSVGVLLVLVGGFTLSLNGCAMNGPPGRLDSQAGLSCVDDTADCINQRRLALEALMSDPSRSWLRQPATPAAYASGVRLFVMLKQKRTFSCDELRMAHREARAARSVLREGQTSGLSLAQISRGALLGDEVSGQLKREMRRRRCKPK